MKRPESTSEKLWRSVTNKSYNKAFWSRYRGVLLVVSIPVLLIGAIVMLVPRHSPMTYDKPHTLSELKHQPASSGGSSSAGGTRYAIVLDAGSTGSRVHVFKFEQSKGDLKLISDTFEQLKPGLSSFADEPKKAAASLQPLMDIAVKTVPKELQASTTVSLKATAGLRLLPGGKADAILAEVTRYLKTFPFKLQEGAVSILDGKEEGGFAWLTLNYLLGKLGKGAEATVAAVDLGGGSVQEAFALTDEALAKAPTGYTLKLKASGTTYNVYVHSYLGYGLMAGRAKVIETSKTANGHPCFSSDFSGVYKYAGKDYDIPKPANPSAFKLCADVSTESLESKKACGQPQDQCTFNGIWHGKSAQQRAYYVSSYFWDRAVESRIVTEKDYVQWETTPAEFGFKAQAACGRDVPGLLKEFPDVKQDQAPYFCLDLAFCFTLLTEGFRLPPASNITLVKQIPYNGQNIEAAWPLGAAVNDLSS